LTSPNLILALLLLAPPSFHTAGYSEDHQESDCRTSRETVLATTNVLRGTRLIIEPLLPSTYRKSSTSPWFNHAVLGGNSSRLFLRASTINRLLSSKCTYDVGSRNEWTLDPGTRSMFGRVKSCCWIMSMKGRGAGGNDVGILCKMKGGRHAVRRHVDWQSRSIRKH